MKWTFIESENQPLPSAEKADSEGLVAVGGELTLSRLKEAYSKGIYPWFNDGYPAMWWSPNPRMVLFTSELHIPKSMRPILNQNTFKVTVNRDFSSVIEHCASIGRPEQDGTWINPEMLRAYKSWHEEGRVHSFEAWKDEKLVGGLYGVAIGTLFFGESMFATEANASKVAFVKAVTFLHTQGVKLIDCQMETDHLKRFGAKLVPRPEFLNEVRAAVANQDLDWSPRELN